MGSRGLDIGMSTLISNILSAVSSSLFTLKIDQTSEVCQSCDAGLLKLFVHSEYFCVITILRSLDYFL